MLIFYFSSSDGKTSQNLSDGLLNLLFSSNIAIHLAIAIRKLAHLTEYFVLFILASSSFKDFFNTYFLKAWLFVLFFSCSDEFHQLFVAGRCGDIKDVFIDMFGATLAFITILLVERNNVAKRKGSKLWN